MAAERCPAFRFYAKDWRDVKVRRMSLAAQGAYIDILADMWVDSKDQCSILNCDPFLAKSLGIAVGAWKKLRAEIQHADEPLLVDNGARLVSMRLKQEAVKQRKFSEEQRKKGVSGAKKRWEKTDSRGHSTGIAQGMAGNSLSSSSSSLKKGVKKKKRETLAMPEHWIISEVMRKYAQEFGMTPITIEHEFVKCRHRHQESRFTAIGWDSKTWQTWVLNWVSFGRKQVIAADSALPASFRKVDTLQIEGAPMPDEIRALMDKVGKGKVIP